MFALVQVEPHLKVLSRHKTYAASSKAFARYAERVKKANGERSYVCLRIMKEMGEGLRELEFEDIYK